MADLHTVRAKVFTVGIRRAFVIALIGIVALLVIGYLLPTQKGFSSVEMRFTDASSKGLAIVPASCPSSPHNPPIYGPGYTSPVTGATCQGNDVYLQYANCSTAYSHTCGWQCLAGACVIPPPPSFGTFTATNPPGSSGGGGSGGSTFEATGHLLVKPALVRQGDKVRVYWNVVNAASCVVSANNPARDEWSALSSGAEGKLSSAIVSQTTFTLVCASLPEATPPSITETQTVNVVPVFQEI